MDITNLRDAPGCVPIVVDRLWHAWWKAYGAERAEVEEAIAEVLAAPTFPFTLVATLDGQFAGTVTASDMDERPQYSPWIAALWVEPEQRRSGIARTLMQAGLQLLFDQGNQQVYLCARPELRAYYLADGWQLLEQQVGEAEMDIFIRRQLA